MSTPLLDAAVRELPSQITVGRHDGAAQMLYVHAQLSLPYEAFERWTADPGRCTQERLQPMIRRHETNRHRSRDEVVYETPDEVVVYFEFYASGTFVASVSGRSEEAVNAEIERLEVDFPKLDDDPGKIAMTFAYADGRGSRKAISRQLEAPAMDNISGNYTRAVAAELQRLTAPAFRPDAGGRLLLWHGPAGTGKTHAVRALVRAWNDWVDPVYVCDTERFFGQADYMMETLLAPSSKQWRLLVVEDAGEMLSADAATRMGQGLSRLLNVTDGMIGQGLNILVLITTNEPLGAMHQAVTREGRCLSLTEFGPLTQQEARAWLDVNAPEADVRATEATLAQLYAAAAPEPMRAEVQSPQRPFGFAA